MNLRKQKNKKFRLFSLKRYSRYLKVIFTKKVLILIIISSIISNSVFLIQNNKYKNLYSNLIGQDVEIQGKIVSEEKEKYKLKITSKKYKNMYLYLKCKEKLEYGNEVKIYGEYEIPNQASNYKGFNYRNYLKTLKIAGTIKSQKIEVIKKESIDFFCCKINELSTILKNRIEKLALEKEEKAILLGILLGDKSDIEEETIVNFSESNLIHILAISGMHIAYIILITSTIFNKLIGKHYSKIITSVVLIFYMFLTKFPITLVRAGISGIISILSNFFYKKNDIWQSLSLSLIIILINNPFSILNIGLQLSYLAIIGIIVFQNILQNIIKDNMEKIKKRAIRKNKKNKLFVIKLLNSKMGKIVFDSFLLTISCMITIVPVLAYYFNSISIFSIFISILAGFIVGPIILFGIIVLIINFNIFEMILSLNIKVLIYLSKLGSMIPINRVYVVTPNITKIFIYYFIIFLIIFVLKIKNKRNPNMIDIRIRNILSYIKYKTRLNKNRFISIILIICILFSFYKYIPKSLKIYFIDVGQRRLYSYNNS